MHPIYAEYSRISHMNNIKCVMWFLTLRFPLWNNFDTMSVRFYCHDLNVNREEILNGKLFRVELVSFNYNYQRDALGHFRTDKANGPKMCSGYYPIEVVHRFLLNFLLMFPTFKWSLDFDWISCCFAVYEPNSVVSTTRLIKSTADWWEPCPILLLTWITENLLKPLGSVCSNGHASILPSHPVSCRIEAKAVHLRIWIGHIFQFEIDHVKTFIRPKRILRTTFWGFRNILLTFWGYDIWPKADSSSTILTLQGSCRRAYWGKQIKKFNHKYPFLTPFGPRKRVRKSPRGEIL